MNNYNYTHFNRLIHLQLKKCTEKKKTTLSLVTKADRDHLNAFTKESRMLWRIEKGNSARARLIAVVIIRKCIRKGNNTKLIIIIKLKIK